jgi:hypothetical protein
MLSMQAVRPIIPCVYAPMFHMPMSSPKMTKMFGLPLLVMVVAMRRSSG